MRRKLTEEEKKANKLASAKKYRDNNKEAIAINQKAYDEANKDKKRAYDKTRSAYRKARYQSNKESLLIVQKAYSEANKESIAINNKTRYESRRLPHHIVYCLPKYNKNGYIKYAGVTDNPNYRMKAHKTLKNNTRIYI